MNIFDFENKVRSASKNQHHNLDMDGLLNDLHLGASPKRRIGLLPYFGVMALALTGVLMYFTYSVKFDSAELHTNAKSTATVVKATTPKLQFAEVDVDLNANEAVLTTEENKLSVDKQTKTNLIKQGESNIATKAKDQAKKSVSSTLKTSQTRANATTNQKIETILSTKSVFDQNAQNASKKVINTDKIIASANDQKQERSIMQVTSTDQSKRSRQVETISALPQLSIILADEDIADIGFKTLNKKVSECPKFSEGNWNLAIVPEVGILIPLKSLNLQDDNFQATFDDRDNNEASQLSYHTGIGIQFRNKRTGLYIRPSFSYSVINETFTLENTSFVRNEITYELHQFNIPIAIGTSIKHDKVSFDLEGGLNFNFLQKTNGRLFNGGEEFVELDNDQSFFKESIGLGFFAGAAIKTQINTRSEIFLGTRFYFNTLSTSSNQNPIDQRYSFFGVHTGVIYTLF